MPVSRKLFIKTFGCQMNVYDSGRMSDALAASGYVEAASPDEADLVILNTCHIREKAAEKVFSELGRLRLLKSRRLEEGRRMIIGVAGCVAQAQGEEILDRAPVVDLVLGPQAYHKLPEIEQRVRSGERVIEMDFPAEEKFERLRGVDRRAAAAPVSAFLAVQEGCDKFCTFCVVPYTRGAEYSRPSGQILEEARKLAGQGVREITLLGQNVNAWSGGGEHGGNWRLADLLGAVAALPGIERLRYTTSHPRDMDDSLIEAHGALPQLMPYLHLPVQSGSDRILQAMNRRHNAEDYLRILERVRRARPGIALASDFIVGFPGETDADFEATMDLVREVNYAQSYSFKYSPRPGTPAAERDDQVDEALKAERLERLQTLINAQQLAFNAACEGREMAVLFDRPGRRPGQMAGRSPYLQAVHAEAGPELAGQVAHVRIVNAGANSLTAELAGPAAATRKEAELEIRS